MDMCTASVITDMFDEDAPCAVIYACNTILDALASMLDITEMDDTSSYAYCILLARRHGMFTDEELDSLTDMFEYRDHCSTHIYVDDPDEESKTKWKTLLFRTMADMYVKGMM